MRWLLMIAVTLGAVGCGDPAGVGDDNAPDKPSCDRDEVVAWLEAERCPEGWVWGVRWEKPGDYGTTDAQRLPRGDAPSEPGWIERDMQACFEGSVPLDGRGPVVAAWRLTSEYFEYSFVEGDGREHVAGCNFVEDLHGYTIYNENGRLAEQWIWYGDSDKPEYTRHD